MTWMSYAVIGLVFILFGLALRRTCRTLFGGQCGCHGSGGGCCCREHEPENKKPPCCQ
ncbi:hypothetical protein [Allisonella histaminiformans]|uniref:hypothetical protein n=1 Tax=Allisonella histaminiformans TaxID=209880 RepID=UPI0026BE4F1A|nr:hypothetical protein [Allisonella histaminiformans]